MRREIGFALVAVLLVGCGHHPQETASVPHDAYPSAKAFLNGIKHYPYVASTERAARLMNGAKELYRCMTKDEVASELGSPDFSELDFGPKGPNAHWLGSNWMFYISIQSDMSNSKNPSIQVFFYTTDRAQWIVPVGIQGAGEIGAPDLSCTEVKLT